MNNEEITKYIADERARGVRDEDIKKELLAKGWKEEDVNIGLGIAAPEAPIHPQEFSFMHMFEGRLGRWQYFVTSFLFGLIVSLPVLMIMFGLLGISGGLESNNPFGVGLVWIPLWILLAPFSLSFGIRRLHDMNWSGWLMFILLIPLIGGIFSLVMLFKKGTDGSNKYGAPQPDRKLWKTVFNK